MSIDQNLKIIKEKINQLNPQVNLVAVSKNFGVDEVHQAIESGQEIFGENKVAEAKNKWLEVKSHHKNVQLHLIGHLQSNKAKDAVEIFDVIESLDSEKLALALQKEMEKQQKFPEIFIQINIGSEEQKYGIYPEKADEFIKKIRTEFKLNVTGLMAIPPANEEPTLYFALLRQIAKNNDLKNISMGMSGDFEAAIQIGATHVRIGSAIFGNREK
ncbi:MAG: pyridoxal phosphate enzyme (YggS family) [Lentimonas sp.]|jgi:pyridoxal phosphate enzyme (YggS family)